MNPNQELQHRWSILCTKSSVDVQSNNLSLFNVIEQINIKTELFASKKAGAIPMDLELVTLWEKAVNGQEVKGDIEVELQDPDGKSLGKFPYVVSVPKKRLRHFMRFNGLPVTDKPGRYTFKIRKREKTGEEFIEVGEVPIEVNIAYRISKQRKEIRKTQ